MSVATEHQQDRGASAPLVQYIDVGKAINSRHRTHGHVRAICDLGAVTIRHAEVIYRDETRWVIEVIRNPDGIVERQLVFTSFTASVDVFHALVEKYAVVARVAA